jgi:hypothetical protein
LILSRYFLDLGLNAVESSSHNGRLLVGRSDGTDFRTLISGQALPDGIDISLKSERIFWTNMGIPTSNDGSIQSCNLDGSDICTITKPGAVHTPKQLIIDDANDQLYFCDREGVRVMRCRLDGNELETLVERGDWKVEEQGSDQLRWCVGIAISPLEGKFYWTQKGPSKGGKGRIFRANMIMPSGEKATSRSDIEIVMVDLPEPIDLEVDEDGRKLYWSDRGDPPWGNSINSVDISSLGDIEYSRINPKYDVLVRNMHEAIGLKLDVKNGHMYATDIGGSLYRFNIDGGGKHLLLDSETSSFSGICILHI